MNNKSNQKFGIVFFVFFLILALWPLKNGGAINYYLLITSIIFLILGVVNSIILTPLYKIWMKFGIFIGKITSPLVMSIIFFLVVTPIGLFMKILNKDLLNLKKNNQSTYWINIKNYNTNLNKQF
jgi:hypothetical protein|tara:strand:+ start:43 stop:417 length:375 start_codon:yes stop_codon:yes gene_type:complete